MMKTTFYDVYNYPDGSDKRKDYWRFHLGKHMDFSKLKGKKILDVGCGQGTISKILSDAGAHVYAIDYSKVSVEHVKKTYPKIKTQWGDALNLKFSDNFFDGVVSIGVLHHTTDTYKGFQECVRVTKTGGIFLPMLYTKYHHYHFLYKLTWFLRKNGRKAEDIPRIFIKGIRKLTEWYYKEPRTDKDAVHLIADQFFTPIAKFYSKRQVLKWGKENGLMFLGSSMTFFGEHRIYNFKKVAELGNDKK